MARQLQADVKGGHIRTKCPRCEKSLFIEVSPGVRQRVVRCGCGKSAVYQVNHRRSYRGTAFGKAQAVFSDSMETPIRLCDTSELGIGFVIGKEHARALRLGQEIRIKYRSSGNVAQRRVKVRNVNGSRVGAEYA